MTPTPTPLTDANVELWKSRIGIAMVDPHFSEKLERELAHHKAMLAKIRQWLRAGATISGGSDDPRFLTPDENGVWECGGLLIDCRGVEPQERAQ